MRILIVTPYLPHDRIGHGGGRAVRGLLHALARRHRCLLVSLLRPGEEHLACSAAPPGCGLVTVPFLDRHARGLQRVPLAGQRLAAVARSLRDRYPYYASKYACRALVQATIAATRSFEPDIIQVEYLQLAYLLRDLRRWLDAGRLAGPPEHGPAPARMPRLILDSHEIGSLPRRRRAARAGPLRRRWLLQEADAWDRLARDASARADTTLCVTEQDRALLAEAGGRRLATVPLGIDACAETPVQATGPPHRILFLGSFQHPPNRSAAALLCDRVWPQVCDRLPDWELVLAGPGSDTFLAGRPRPPTRIRATGFVDDLAELFSGCRLFAAPLTEGGGIKIKILEAMARGLPVVTTPIGAEGIVSAADDLVWLAPDGESFARHLLDAALDLEGAARRARQARLYVQKHFSWDAVVLRLEDVYQRVLEPADRA